MNWRAVLVMSLASWVVSIGAAEAGGRGRVEVFLHLPQQGVTLGKQFEVPVFVKDGEEDVISYSFRLRYNRKVFRVVAIRGGTFEGFSKTPVANPASFGSGKTDFTANNKGLVRTPADAFNVATITLEVIGLPKKQKARKIRLHKTPGRDVTLRSNFRGTKRLRFKEAQGIVEIEEEK